MCVNLQSHYNANYQMKTYIFSMIIAMLPLTAGAQKITLGSATTKDGGEYQGEMMSGKPQGKGKTIYKNGKSILSLLNGIGFWSSARLEPFNAP